MKKIALVFIALGISGCVDYSARPFFRENYKVDCGNGKRMTSFTLCNLDAFGY
jgi:hypothetical protein